MRTWIIGAAALLAVALPGVAAAQTGYAGVVYANVEAGSSDEDAYGVEGAVAFAGSGSITFEVDAAVLDADDSDTATALTGHIYARNDNHLFGGFVGVSDSDSSTTWTAGLEANKFFDRWTLAGALVYGNNDDLDADGYGVNVEARVFPTDNFRLQASAGWANIDFASSDDDVVSYGIGGEYLCDRIPVSVAASYRRTEFDSASIESDAVMVSVRYNWGASLFDRDRSGASQAGIAGISF